MEKNTCRKSADWSGILTTGSFSPQTNSMSVLAGENGADILAPYFSRIFWESYKDSLLVPDAEPLISYILSCHGNQNQYLLDKYKDFRGFVSRKTKDGFFITKDAGIFLCEK